MNFSSSGKIIELGGSAFPVFVTGKAGKRLAIRVSVDVFASQESLKLLGRDDLVSSLCWPPECHAVPMIGTFNNHMPILRASLLKMNFRVWCRACKESNVPDVGVSGLTKFVAYRVL